MKNSIPEGIEILKNQLEAREKYWRDWNGRAANHAAILEAEIEALKKALRESCDEERARCRAEGGYPCELQAEIEALKKRNQALEKYGSVTAQLDAVRAIDDAERYRLVRRNIAPRQLVENGFRDGGDLAPSETIEARIDWMIDDKLETIDAAMEAEK